MTVGGEHALKGAKVHNTKKPTEKRNTPHILQVHGQGFPARGSAKRGESTHREGGTKGLTDDSESVFFSELLLGANISFLIRRTSTSVGPFHQFIQHVSSFGVSNGQVFRADWRLCLLMCTI